MPSFVFGVATTILSAVCEFILLSISLMRRTAAMRAAAAETRRQGERQQGAVNNFVFVDFLTFAVAIGVKVLFIGANYMVNHKKSPAEAGQS